jgi:hypothetical protein
MSLKLCFVSDSEEVDKTAKTLSLKFIFLGFA